MLLSSFLMGIILIICGFLVKVNPNLIAGYNTMNEKDKGKVDIKGLSSMMKKGLILIGALVIIVGSIMKLINFKASYGVLITSCIVVIGVIIMIVNAQKYYKKH